jgi:hypothetical protein
VPLQPLALSTPVTNLQMNREEEHLPDNNNVEDEMAPLNQRTLSSRTLLLQPPPRGLEEIAKRPVAALEQPYLNAAETRRIS